MADVQILATGVQQAPLDYAVPDANVIIPKALFASYDGSGSAGVWVPAIQIISDSGHTVTMPVGNTQVAAGGSADCSWFPWWRGLTGGVTPKPPNPIGVLFAWYDFADSTTITLDGSGNIQTIADKSGNGHDASQSNPAKRPGVTTVHGNNAGLFTHGAQTYLGAASFSSTVTQPLTIAAVYTQTIAAGGTYWPGAIGKLTNHQGVWMYVSGGNNQPALGTTGGFIVQVPINAPFTQHMFVGLAHGLSSYLRLDGVQQNGSLATDGVSSILLGTQQDTPAAPGEDDFLNGALCEVLYYSGQLSAAQLAGLEAYLRAKWGTP